MSKRILSTCLVVGLVASSSAFASQARQLVMGTQDPFGVLSGGTHGSFFYDDNMNIFFNPSYVNNFKNWASIEKASGYAGTASTAEGGFVFEASKFNVGFYMNRQDALNNIITSNTNVYGTAAPVRPFDLMIGADMGVKWGFGLTYASNKRGMTDDSATDLTLRAGVQVADFEPFVNYQVIGNDQVNGSTTNKNKSMTIGTKYKFGEWTPFAAYRQDTYTPQGGRDTKANAWGLGVGRGMKVADSAHLHYGFSYWQYKTATALNSGINTKQDRVPLNVSVEGEATSWLTLRAGLQYNLVAMTGGLTDNNNTTTGRLGAGVKFGKAMLDMAVGNGAVGTANVDSTVFDFSNSLFSQASLTYNW